MEGIWEVLAALFCAAGLALALWWLMGRLLGRASAPADYPYEQRAWQTTYEALMARKDQPADR